MRPAIETRSRILRYGVAGLGAALLYFGAAMVLVELVGFGPVLSAAIATLLVIVTSYAVNRLWVFDTNRSHASAFLRYVVASALSIALNTGLMYVMVDTLRQPYFLGLAIATIVVPPVNFLVNSWWCFRPSIDRVN